jgi:hypothetical protein
MPTSNTRISHTSYSRRKGARLRGNGGGTAGGYTRMPVGKPSPPRGGHLKPHSRAILGTVGAGRADNASRTIRSFRESHVRKA